jgi:F420H(2)-dependent quinone reductase
MRFLVTATPRKPWVPPRWFVRSAWALDRWRYRISDGRRVLARPRAGVAGRLRLRTIGRRSGEERAVILSYLQDGDRFVTLAMNGWGDAPPAWWLNLLARPDAEIDTADGKREVLARAAAGEERARLWEAFSGARGWGDVHAYAAHRAIETPVVVLEPR